MLRQYGFSELDEWLPPGLPAPLPGDHKPPPDADLDGNEVDLLAARYATGDKRFARTWARERDDFDDQSASTYDLAVCVKAADMGADDATCWALVRRWRQLHCEDLSKADRDDYAAATLAKARAGAPPEARPSTPGGRAVVQSLPPSFWNERPLFDHVRRAAHSRLVSAPGLLFVVLERAAVATTHMLQLPPIVGRAAPLSFYVALLGPSGLGKTGLHGVACELVPIDDPLVVHAQLGSGEGLAEALFAVEEELVDGKPKKVKRQTKHRLTVYADEGETFTALRSRKGSTLATTLRQAWTGAELGQTNASGEKRREVFAGSYTFGVVLGLQDSLAEALLADVAAGTPQRFAWASALDPAAPAAPPAWPGPLPWAPPATDTLVLEPGPGGQLRHLVGVDERVARAIRERRRAVLRGETTAGAIDAHGDLLQLKMAELLAILDGRIDQTADDWELAGALKKASDQERARVTAVVAEEAAQRERAASKRQASRAVEAEAAKERRRIVDAARKITEKVRAEPDRWTRKLLVQSMRHHRDVFDDALEHTVAEEWVVEVDEPGQGDDRRALRPGPKRPS
jgi:hypothetical protein